MYGHAKLVRTSGILPDTFIRIMPLIYRKFIANFAYSHLQFMVNQQASTKHHRMINIDQHNVTQSEQQVIRATTEDAEPFNKNATAIKKYFSEKIRASRIFHLIKYTQK